MAFSINEEFKLLRYCDKIGYNVEDSDSILLCEFRKRYRGVIISEIDRMRFNGDMYERLGFNLSYDSEPGYWWFKDGQMEDSDILDVDENMYDNNYIRIFNCGVQVWKMM